MNEIPEQERELLARAERRIGWFVLGLTPLGAAAAAYGWGWRVGVAFAAGGVLAYGNYRWIVAVVDTLVRARRERLRPRDYVKLLAPVVLLAGLLYAMFVVSLQSFAGIVGGVLLLVPAVFIEALVQISTGARK